jgi:hypothetical protein
VEVPNPAYAAAVAAEQQRAAAAPGTPAIPIASPPTLTETRHRVELRNARDGRGPDYLGTFAGMQVLFRNGSPTDPAERRVTVRLAPRPPRVQDRELAAARETANLLIGEPVTVRWEEVSWIVSRDELAGMLRYQQGRDGLTAYLTRDGLLAKAGEIARQAERLATRPTDTAGQPLPVDVPNTAAAIWQQASTVAANRTATVVWVEPEEPPADAAPLPSEE